MVDQRICLIGAGNMGGAIVRGWLDAGVAAESISVVDPSPNPVIAEALTGHGVSIAASASEIGPCDLVLLAVKPQVVDAVLPSLTTLMTDDNVLLSVAAGVTIKQLAAPFGPNTRIVRAMPNTPAQVSRGVTVCCPNERVSAEQKATITTLLTTIGTVEWVGEEALMDAVTGVSGSGPAYVFHMVEAMAEAGRAAGLPDRLANALALQTVIGAGELMHQAEEEPGQLRKNVTSPNGTTEAALKILMAEDGLSALMTKAVQAATDRSRELAKT